MKKPTKIAKKVSKKKAKAPEPVTEVVEKSLLQPITQRFASDDLNVVVDKINEIVASVNKVL